VKALPLTVLALATALAPSAQAKDVTSVLVVGPKGPALVVPYRVVEEPLSHLRLVAAPAEPYVLVFPLMRGLPARPGRWFPGAGVVCSGWRSGVEAGCAPAPALRRRLSAAATGLFEGEPARLLELRRGGSPLLSYGNEATAVRLALLRHGVRRTPPPGCVAFTARWSEQHRPRRFCVPPAGGLYANGRVYPLAPAAAAYLIGP
jgi:hypothetical protein